MRRATRSLGFGQGVQYGAADDANKSSHASKSRGAAGLGDNGSGRRPEYPEYRARPSRCTNQPTHQI